jgi:hypothetical protein
LDQIQAGTAALQIDDPNEVLNPLNNGSPFMTGGNTIKPYRPVRISATWPVGAGTGNLINPTVDPAADPSFENGTGAWTPVVPATTAVLSTAQAWLGNQSLLVTQSSAGAGFGAVNQFQTTPDVTYVFSAYVYPTLGAVTVQVVDDAGTVTSSATATVTGQWTRLSLAWTPLDTLERVTVYGTGHATPTFHLDGTQLEFGAVTGDFTSTGPALYRLYSGYVERWPMKYNEHGIRGCRPLTAVDALAILSRTKIIQSYAATILADTPAIYMPLDESSAPSQVQRPTGGAPMIGTIVTGTDGQSNYGGTPFLDGTGAITLLQQNAYPAVRATNPARRTRMGTLGGSVSLSSQALSFEFWLLFSAGTPYFGLGIFLAADAFGSAGAPHQVGVYTSAGRIYGHVSDPNGGGQMTGALGPGIFDGFPDGKWHHIVLVMRPGATMQTYTDGVAGSVVSLGFTPSASYSVNNIYAQVTTEFGGGQSEISLSRIAVYPYILTPTQINNHFQRGTGYSGEKTGARVARLLGSYWAGAKTVAPGYATMAPDYGYDGRTVLDTLQETQDTERGLLYVTGAGEVRFEDRLSRYATQTSRWTFGENPSGGEYPYSNYAADFDPTYVYSQVVITRPGNSVGVPQTSTQGMSDYGQRVLTQTLQVDTDFQVQQAGAYYLTRYGNPRVRIEILEFNPAANPDLWPVVLSLELSQRITVKRRAGGLTTTNDYYVEQIAHRVDNKGAWKVQIQASPVFVPSSWVLGDTTTGVLGSTTTPVY